MKKPLYKQVRKSWVRKPETQIKNSDKIYDRNKSKREWQKELEDCYEMR